VNDECPPQGAPGDPSGGKFLALKIAPPTGASPEVMDHHLAAHRRWCGPDRGAIRWESPCGNVAVCECKRCGGQVARAYRVWCEHAAEFWTSVA
jgi:hypothetical protein